MDSQLFDPRTRRRMLISSLSSIVFAVVVIASTTLILIQSGKIRPPAAHVQIRPAARLLKSRHAARRFHAQSATRADSYSAVLGGSSSSSARSSSPDVALICNSTVYPQACLNGFSSQSGSIQHSGDLNPQRLVSIALKAALSLVHESHAFAKNCSTSSGSDGLHLLERQAIDDCIQLMDSAKDQLNLAISNLSAMALAPNAAAKRDALLNLNVWLSASLSFQTACTDGFQLVTYGKCEKAMLKRQEQVAEVLVNSLDFVKKLFKHGTKRLTNRKTEAPASAPNRHLLQGAAATDSRRFHVQLRRSANDVVLLKDGFPHWVCSKDRKLLQAEAPSPSSVVQHAVMQYADMVVAQDGSGDYLNITEALKNVPQSRAQRFVVYVKEGVYEEIVEVSKSQTNLTFIGDGIGYTVITGSNNVGSGLYTTFRTATFGIYGDGFMARDITFRNTAGPEGYQAVALRGSADYLVFYRCSFEGYQDTLYALSSRHFYRECTISGTVDFIFGNAIASFQSCLLLARRPLKGQQNTLTAQGRKIDLDISGFSFQNCTLIAAPELVSAPFPVSSYLGRPWKAYSRTVFMQSFMDTLIHPAGWLPWNASNPFTDTVYYGEFQNRGPGSATDNRVPWKGVHPSMNSSDAVFFTAENFILGSTWLPLSQLHYTSGLTSSFNTTSA